MTTPVVKAYSPTAEKIDEIVRRIAAGFDPVRIILFGSCARHEAGPDSDVDLLVVLEDAPNTRDAAAAVADSVSDVLVSKDIVVTTQAAATRGGAPSSVLAHALATGVVVYERR